MSAELIDPFAPISVPLTPDELAAIKADIYADPLLFSDDRQVMPDLLKKAIDTLGVLALAGHEGAADGLRDLQGRVLSGVPFGEPQEPAWACDPEPPNYTKNRGE